MYVHDTQSLAVEVEVVIPEVDAQATIENVFLRFKVGGALDPELVEGHVRR